MLPPSQKAIRLHPTARDIRVDDVQTPNIVKPDDAIVRIELAGLCGSDLHSYRGNEGPFEAPFVMGHELYGEIVLLGESFLHTTEENITPSIRNAQAQRRQYRPTGYSNFKPGMKVIATFSVSCLECEYCLAGLTSRCESSQLLGCPALPGAQAQYIRIPKAGGTLVPISSSNAEKDIPPRSAILLADILPTGYFAAIQAFHHPNLSAILHRRKTLEKGDTGYVDSLYSKEIDGLCKQDEPRTVVFAVVGLGPVGLCALISLLDLIHSGLSNDTNNNLKFRVLIIDLLESRRAKAEEVAKRLLVANRPQEPRDNPNEAVLMDVEVQTFSPENAPSNLCHAVLEVVGHPSSLSLAASLCRPFGIISSVGVHTSPQFSISPPMLYAKNLSLSFGRCPVRSLLPASRTILEKYSTHTCAVDAGTLKVFEGFVEKVVGMRDEESVKSAYANFDQGKTGKVCFDPWR